VTITEQAVTFACGDDALVGVLALPQAPERPSRTGVVIVVGGPQYRAGSHRQFVSLARALAAAGYASLRFDARGMGDSAGERQSFEHQSDDITAAIDVLQRQVPQVDEVVLWGLCDGASAALLYCDERRDARVRGLCLANPWVRSEASLARTQLKHYYTQRLMQREFWAKLLKGGVAPGAPAELLRSLRRVLAGSLRQPREPQARIPFQQRMALAWNVCDGDLLLLLSADDYTAREFVEFVAADPHWSNSLRHPRLTRDDLDGADHTFSGAASRALVERATLRWLENRAARRRLPEHG
jgi:uncharacterized protein